MDAPERKLPVDYGIFSAFSKINKKFHELPLQTAFLHFPLKFFMYINSEYKNAGKNSQKCYQKDTIGSPEDSGLCQR